MPRTKSSNIAKRTSSPSGKKTEGKKRDASEMESELSSSPKPEDTSDRQVPVNRDASTVVRRFRMKLLPAVRGNPNRYKDYSPDHAGGSVSGGEPVAGGSGLGKARKRSTSARQTQSGANKRGRTLESPDRSAHSKRFAGHLKIRKFEKMRAKRRQKRAPAAKKDKRTSSSEISSVDSTELVSSDGNNADSSSSEHEQPKRAKRVKQ